MHFCPTCGPLKAASQLVVSTNINTPLPPAGELPASSTMVPVLARLLEFSPSELRRLQEKAALAAQEAEYDKVYDKVSSEPAIAQHQLPPSAAHHGCVYTAATCIFNM